jgi:GTPase Era involved in 16S rRNA processing
MQLVLVDTPGVMQSQRNPLEGRMMSYVRGSMREADAVVAIVDASQVGPLSTVDSYHTPVMAKLAFGFPCDVLGDTVLGTRAYRGKKVL